MCGIAGILAKPALVNDKMLTAMAASLAHRGPDDQGTQILHPPGSGDLAVGLVHRRLSIIDLSPAGHQPMSDERAGNRVGYNGEIYNHQELRRELESLGHVFRSRSDTEVILKAYAQYGTACVERLRGMFAFAIWDGQACRFFLAVDRFGIKPLYVCRREGLFAFSSEIRTLLRSGLVPKEVEPRAVETFLAYGAVQAPLTMVKDVVAMLPGQFMVHSAKSRETTRSTYWQPARAACADVPRSRREVVAKTREILAGQRHRPSGERRACRPIPQRRDRLQRDRGPGELAARRRPPVVLGRLRRGPVLGTEILGSGRGALLPETHADSHRRTGPGWLPS